MKFIFVGFAFILVLVLVLMFMIFDHVVSIRNKSYFDVDHGGAEVGSC